jgi:very-short-patch-repair endonuclease
MKNQNLFNRKSLKFFRSSLRNESTSAETEVWNILKSKKLNAKNSEDNTV